MYTSVRTRPNAAPSHTSWATPQWLFDSLNQLFHFELDVAASPHNAKCEKIYTEEQNGLTQKWEGMVFCNPPYGRGLGHWVEKAAVSAAKDDTTVVMLLPAYTSNSWWHEFVIPYGEVLFLRGRLLFNGIITGSIFPAPFSSAIVVFRGNDKADYLKQCITCKDFFYASRSDAMVCSVTCRVQQQQRQNGNHHHHKAAA